MVKKKIGCVIAYKKNHNNYGTFLQGFALLELIKNFGYEPRIIKYIKKRSIFEIIRIFPPYLLSGGSRFIKPTIKHIINFKIYSDYKSFIIERLKIVNKAKDRYLEPYCDQYIGFTNLKNGSKEYGLIISGSDQIWIPYGIYSKFFNLLFVDDCVPKAAYSSSFGVRSIPFWQRKMTKLYLDRIDKIGVREQSGKEIVETISSNKAKVVLDPTILFNSDKWNEIIEDTKPLFEKPYIFCYLLGNSREHREAILELKNKTGLPIIAIKYMDEFVKEDRKFGDFAPKQVGPFEFVKYIRDAAYVCTDSFHCTAFSISFNKQFISFYRYNKNNKNTPNTRIDSFLGLFDLTSRIYKGNIEEQINNPIEYHLINKKLDNLRNDSLEFLKSELALSK